MQGRLETTGQERRMYYVEPEGRPRQFNAHVITFKKKQSKLGVIHDSYRTIKHKIQTTCDSTAAKLEPVVFWLC